MCVITRWLRTGCSGIFFTIHCNPSLAYIAVRDFQSSQCNASVQSLPLAGNFSYNQAECWRGGGGKLSMFNEHPVGGCEEQKHAPRGPVEPLDAQPPIRLIRYRWRRYILSITLVVPWGNWWLIKFCCIFISHFSPDSLTHSLTDWLTP